KRTLSTGKHLTSPRPSVELRCIAADRFQLGLDLVGDVHDEGGLHRVLTVRERVEELEGAVRRTGEGKPCEAREEAGVVRQLRSDPVVRVATGRKGQDDDAGAEGPD